MTADFSKRYELSSPHVYIGDVPAVFVKKINNNFPISAEQTVDLLVDILNKDDIDIFPNRNGNEFYYSIEDDASISLRGKDNIGNSVGSIELVINSTLAIKQFTLIDEALKNGGIKQLCSSIEWPNTPEHNPTVSSSVRSPTQQQS